MHGLGGGFQVGAFPQYLGKGEGGSMVHSALLPACRKSAHILFVGSSSSVGALVALGWVVSSVCQHGVGK